MSEGGEERPQLGPLCECDHFHDVDWSPEMNLLSPQILLLFHDGLYHF